jgi:hypothetical protein
MRADCAWERGVGRVSRSYARTSAPLPYNTRDAEDCLCRGNELPCSASLIFLGRRTCTDPSLRKRAYLTCLTSARTHAQSGGAHDPRGPRSRLRSRSIFDRRSTRRPFEFQASVEGPPAEGLAELLHESGHLFSANGESTN